jgi:diguanylate cyclase (GGDEF)-like protein
MLAESGPSQQPILDSVLSAVGDGVLVANVDGSSLYMNAAARRILGIPAEEAPKDVHSYHPDLSYLHDFSPVPDADFPLQRALRGDDTHGVELFVRSPSLPDGAVISVTARPMRASDGRVVGGFSVFHDVGARRRAEEELRAANAKLGDWVAELERRAQIGLLTNEMADLLQSCRTTEEFHDVVSRFAERIFDAPGALFTVNTSRSALEMVVGWGGAAREDRVFKPEGCWALRRGRVHRAGGKALGPPCEHAQDDTHGYTCIPMMGQGEALGILHVRHSAHADAPGELGTLMEESALRTIVSVSEHVALALANLKLRETLRMQAIRDPLTGLFNRRHMEESLEREVARANRSGGSVAAVMIDLDHFKRFNDTFGHAAADVALRETAALIRTIVRPDDIACRFGGEELVLIFPDTTLETAMQRAEIVRVAISEQQLRFNGAAIGAVTASLGVAALPHHATTAESLLHTADEALYLAKGAGRNRVAAKGPAPRGRGPAEDALHA